MDLEILAPWHRRSYDRFLSETLPALLAERMPLIGFAAEEVDAHTRRVRVTVGRGDRQATVTYEQVPACDEQGLFKADGHDLVVLPLVSDERLDEAEVRCVGEQLLEYIDGRLGKAPSDLQWDESLLRSWLPLAKWLEEFFANRAPWEWGVVPKAVQVQDATNWLSRCEHLRRFLIPGCKEVIAPGQLHRAGPFMTPEGPNIGRIQSVARGAEIRDGRFVVLDDSPLAALSVTTSMIPLLEHDDANRLLMGANMMRQWRVPEQGEPALVQTGHEPDAAGFWCGRNLMTAFMSLGADTFEDALVLSESAAERMGYFKPLDIGDKLSNRHGTKGTVSRILPDERMPHLPDGTPVGIVFSFMGCHTRLNFGQIREAVLGRIAHAEGAPIVLPPFDGPDEATLRARLKGAGLPESGMETLTDGAGGPAFSRPTTVGYVYWGKTHHLSREKLHFAVAAGPGQRQEQMEYAALREAGAWATIAEHFNTRAAERAGVEALAEQWAAGPVPQTATPTPRFLELLDRLEAANIRAALDGGALTFAFGEPAEPALRLARAIAHPWRIDRAVEKIGVRDELPQYAALTEANDAARRMLSGNAPESLAQKAVGRLQAALRAYLDALVTDEHVRPCARTLFSARAVISPGGDLSLDQIGLAEEVAWALFAPRVARELGDAEAVAKRSAEAASALDRILADSWVLCNRAPSVMPTSFLAFRPVRIPEPVFRLHPLACAMMNADFDGDQMAVFLPVTEAGQREAAERLSVAGHLRRDPNLMRWAMPVQDMIWGLAERSRTEAGRGEINALAGTEIPVTGAGHVDRFALVEAMKALARRESVAAALSAAERLMRRGFEVVRRSGASLSPFIGESLSRPPTPAGDEPDAWNDYTEQLTERLTSRTDFDDPDMGPQRLAVRSGARGTPRQLLWLLGPRGVHVDIEGRPTVIVRHGMRDGLTAQEAFDCVVGARRGLAQTLEECARIGYEIKRSTPPAGFSVLLRAMRTERPGVVFAQAAAIGEIDPLTDLDSRLLVGLPVGGDASPSRS